MKRILILTFFISSLAISQELQGDWYGEVSIATMATKFNFHITNSDRTFQTTMDIPDQKAIGFPLTSTTLENGKLVMESTDIKGVFNAEYKDNQFIGTFTQNGMSFPFWMKKGVLEQKVVNRPQEPMPKFNYLADEVMFENTIDHVVLSGTLTYPKGKGPFPAVILVSGSGPQNRNSEVLDHKPFFVIADFLTQNGFAVLRFDDRGVGKSTGDFGKATTKVFAKDVEAAAQYLRNNSIADPKKISLIGHSEGGVVVPIVASNPKNKIASIILLAGTALPGTEVILLQQELIARVSGEEEAEIASNRKMTEAIFSFLKEHESEPEIKESLEGFILEYLDQNPMELSESMSKEQLINTLVGSYSSDWIRFFLLYNPKEAFLQVKCPVLALNGSNDLQVTPKENLSQFSALAKESGNKQVTTQELEGLNHLFQHSKTGAPSEYAEIEETFSPEVLIIMKDWLLNAK